jgi:hypothetical protein
VLELAGSDEDGIFLDLVDEAMLIGDAGDQ